MKKILTRKENLKDSIPLMSLLTSLNLILVSFITYLPFTNLFIFFILPIPSLLCALFINKKYYWIYFIINLSLGLLVSIGDISFCLLNLVPSLIIPFVISLLIKLGTNKYFIFFISSIFIFFINLLSIYVIFYLFKFSIIDFLINLLNITYNSTLDLLLLPLIYLFSIFETLILYLIIYYETKSLIDLNIVNSNDSYFIYLNLLLTFISVFVFHFHIKIFYLFLFISLSGTFILLLNYIKTLQNLIIFIILFIFTWIIYICFYNYYSLKNSFILLLTFSLLSSLYELILYLNKLDTPKNLLKLNNEN